jgi:regulator of protease activity HflC (stomatin/prohibitin superfamily)
MSAVSNEGQKEGDGAIRVLSSDGLEVTIDLSVLYKVSPEKAPYIMQNIGETYTILKRKASLVQKRGF